MGDSASRRITLARLGAPFGVKGWMKLISYTDPPENILDYRHFLVGEGSNQGDLKTLEIDQCQAHGKSFIAHVKGCDERDMTRLYTGKELLIEAEELPELEPDEYYWHQLEGMKVVNLQQELLGQVKKLMETGANDVLVVSPTEDSIDKIERLIPFLKDRVIRKIDQKTSEIVVDWEKNFLTDQE